MSQLPTLPKPPKGVTHALTCHHSVLSTDQFIRGCLPFVYHRVFGFDYSPTYYVYDDGAIRWDFSSDDSFTRQLSPDLNPDEVAQTFITTTARTARRLVRTAQIVSSPTRWQSSHFRQDLLEDLNTLWDAYEDHTTCLPTFWSVESLLTSSLVDELKNAGFQEEVDAGLPTFVTPSEPNWFALEQLNLTVLRSRLADSVDDKAISDAAKSGDVLHGRPTSPGTVRGRVRILSMHEKNSALTPDEIIVTKMTRPEFGAALDTALAYVTDEGGILCHAAIVAREKQKPCVTGLRNAIEILRTGMLIEVNGSAGTVTVVEDIISWVN